LKNPHPRNPIQAKLTTTAAAKPATGQMRRAADKKVLLRRKRKRIQNKNNPYDTANNPAQDR
jgi:hypothetical protein